MYCILWMPSLLLVSISWMPHLLLVRKSLVPIAFSWFFRLIFLTNRRRGIQEMLTNRRLGIHKMQYNRSLCNLFVCCWLDWTQSGPDENRQLCLSCDLVTVILLYCFVSVTKYIYLSIYLIFFPPEEVFQNDSLGHWTWYK